LRKRSGNALGGFGGCAREPDDLFLPIEMSQREGEWYGEEDNGNRRYRDDRDDDPSSHPCSNR